MKRLVNVTINGVRFAEEVEDRLLLVWFIREVAGLTGTHVGCDTGHCGACTVMLDGKAVKSCMVLAAQADRSQVSTIEGLAKEGKIKNLQQSFIENFAIQCGYCTPGLLVSAYFLLSKNPSPTDKEIITAIHGNLCRCEGYPGIIRAIKAAAASEKVSGQ